MKKIFITTFLLITSLFFTEKAKADIVKNIEITGNNRISEDDIMVMSGIKIGQNVDNKILNEVLKKMYSSGNFADISIQNNKNNLTINVLETPIIGDIFFVGSSKFDQDEVKKSLSVKSRQIYSKSKIKLDAEKLNITFKKMGFLNSTVEPRVVFLEDNSVDVIFNINEGEISKINKIYFFGNNHLSDTTLLENIVSKTEGFFSLTGESGNFEEEKLTYDEQMIERLYKNHGYAKAQVVDGDVVFDKKNYNFDIYYRIEEGDFYKFGQTTITDDIRRLDKNNKIDSIIKTIKQGKMYEIDKIQEVQYKITDYLKSLGYANITTNYTQSFDEENKIIDINYDIILTQKVYIDKISIKGNERTRNNVILREMMIKEGDLYDKEKIEISKNRLWMLGFFKNVDIKEKPIPNTDLVDLEVVLEEQFSGRINATIGYSTFYGISGGVDFTINNFLGMGTTASIALDRNGYSEGGSLSYYDPYIFSDKYPIGFSAGASYSHFGALWGATDRVKNLLYHGHTYSVSAGFSFEILNRLTLSTSLSTTGHFYYWDSNSKYKLWQMLLGTRFAHKLGISITYNKLNRARFATKGYMLRYTFNVAGFGIPNSQHFVQNQIDAVANIQLFGEDLILHLEGSAGITTSLKSNQLLGMEHLYTLGGYSRMRGFDFYGIGPRITSSMSGDYTYASEGKQYYYLSAELRTPLFIPKDVGIYFSVFADAGSVWGFAGLKKEIEYNAYDEDKGRFVDVKETVKDGHALRLSVGIGVTLVSAMLGEIGVYYAHPILKTGYDRTLEFGIKMGQSF